MSSRPNSLRVLHVIPSVAPCRGGPSKAVIEMVHALRLAGVDAEIATTNDDGESKLKVKTGSLLEHEGVPIRFFNRLSGPLAAVREFSYAPGFQHWLKRHIHNYDLIHVHAIFSYCSTKAMQLARQKQVPYFVRPIGQLERWSLLQSAGRKKRYLQLIEEANLQGASRIQFTAASEQSQAEEAIQGLAGVVIPLGLELPMEVRNSRSKIQQRWKLPNDTPIILYLSRLHPKKGLEFLMQAIAKLPDTEMQLVIAGDGDSDYRQVLQKLSQDLDIADRCRFVGFVKGAEKNLLLQGADLFALTSHSENFGIAVLEAMAAGTAVLTSEHVALANTITTNKLGYVTKLDTQEITAQLQQALSDIDHLRDLGERARLFVEQHYQWSRVAHRLKTEYQTVLVSPLSVSKNG